MSVHTGRMTLPALVIVPGAALLLYGVAAALWNLGIHGIYFSWLRLYLGNPFQFPFVDTYGVLAAAECQRLGINVYLVNPCDVLGRTHNYSPLWLQIIPGFVSTRYTGWIGLGLGFSYILSLPVILRPTNATDVVVFAAIALSPMAAYALERGNVDLLIYALIVVGIGLGRLRGPWRFASYGIYLFAGLLKYYPFVLLIMIARERRWRVAVVAWAAAAALTLLFIVGYHMEMREALANVPGMSYDLDAFSARDLPFGLIHQLDSKLYRHVLGTIMIGAFAMVAIFAALRMRSLLDAAGPWPDAGEMDSLIVGTLLLTGCFLLGQNGAYRGIFFVLVMPGLLCLRRRASAPATWRFLTSLIGVSLFVAWEQCLRALSRLTLGGLLDEKLASVGFFLFWLTRELLWWWLIAGFIAIIWQFLENLPLVQGLRLTVGKRAESL